jgi:hypothetical protein
MMKKVILFTILGLLTYLSSLAQIANTAFMPLKEDKMTSAFKGEIDVTTFFKNNEYFTKINPGRTYLGWQLFPKVSYSPSKKTKLRGGFLFQKTFGIDTTYIKPYFALEAKFKNWKITFGSIDNTLKHGLIEPLMDYESYYNDRLEEGFEIEYQDPTKSLDLWIDWEEAITRNSANQERFFVGLKANKKILNSNKLLIETPATATFYHRGGSINNTTAKVSTRIGSALGLKIRIKGEKNTWIFDNYGLYSYDLSPNISHTFQDGYGMYLNAGLKRKHLTYLVSYWYGEEFFTPKSGPLFNSTSIEGQRITERIRELLLLRVIYTQHLTPELQVDFRAEPYYDLQNSAFEYAIGIAFRYNLFLNKQSFK